MQRLMNNWRSSPTARWIGWAVGYALLSWAGWVGSYQLLDRLEGAGTPWNVWFGGLIFPLILAFLGGLWLRAPWWISTAPFVILLSMLGVSAYLVLTTPDDRFQPEHAVFIVLMIMVAYPVVTLNAAKVGVQLGWLLAGENRAAASGPWRRAFAAVALIVQGVVTTVIWALILGFAALSVTIELTPRLEPWWP